MKKYVQNVWVRFLAILLCSATVVTGVGAGILFVGVASSSKNEIYKNGQKYIAENYAAYIYDQIYNGSSDFEKDVKNIENFLEDKNFTCSIKREISGIGEDIYSNLDNESDWDYEFCIANGTYVNYNVDSVLDALRISPVIHEYVYTQEALITDYFFEEATGLFYYEARGQYFFADYIKVCQDGIYYDYKLKKSEAGNRIYYNSYYDVALDTSTYSDWDWVDLNNSKLVFAMEESAASNEIKLITDDRIQDYLYTGIYHIDEYNKIVYYPETPLERYIIRINVYEDVTNGDDIYHDMFLEWKSLTDTFYENENIYQVVLVISILFFGLSFGLLIYSAKNKREELGLWNKLPVGCFTFVVGLFEILLMELMFLLVYESQRVLFKLIIYVFIVAVFGIAFFAFLWLQNMITRFKTKTFIRYSEIYYGLKFLKWCWNKWKYIWGKLFSLFMTIIEFARENTKLFTKGLMVMCIISLIQLMAIIICRWEWDNYLLLFFIAKLVEFPVVSFILLQMQKLQEGSKRIAAGNLSEPINTSKMIWEFKQHGENINKVSDGISLAVEERMKSERFKTELITNVSHDIKTPLTSIINYVDLIKKEEIQDETLQEYVDVLDRQSARLKKLLEDLMDASKASTGNLAVNMEACNVEVLLTQLIGEFEDKLLASQLEVIVQKPEEPVYVNADGRHLWRVLDNLLNNVCKYSLPETRVYVSFVKMENEGIITFKNISKAPLNIPSEELMERFVRGDDSRNTEGSGLGLSIAQSLTELMKGSMKLEIDGDLFKVTLKFQTTKK